MSKNSTPQFYNNNPKLKAANVQIQATREQLLEFARCRMDPIYFIENYVYIINLDTGPVLFKLWPYQRKIIEDIHNSRFVIAKCHRQSGKSTAIINGYFLWRILFMKNQNLGIRAQDAGKARKLLKRLKDSYEYLPFWIQRGVVIWNKTSIELENGSKIDAAATTGKEARGDSYHAVLLDEFAHVEQTLAQEFYTAVYPTITSGTTTKIIMASTPLGMGLFYKFWIDAVEGRNGYRYHEVNWKDDPRKTPEWEKEARIQMGDESFEQEFLCTFNGSSNSLIQSAVLKTIPFRDPVDEKLKVRIYEQPGTYPSDTEPGKVIKNQYLVVADVAEGQGLDASAFSVFDITKAPYKQVAAYSNKDISHLEYPNLLNAISKYYHDAYIVVENNKVQQVGHILWNELECEFLLGTVKEKGKRSQKLNIYTGGRNAKVGVTTSANVKNLGCSNLKSMMQHSQLILSDFQTLAELTTFVTNGSSYAAQSGSNDDLVMTLVIFAWMTTEEFFKELTNVNLRDRMYGQSAKEMYESIFPSIAIDNGLEGLHFPASFTTTRDDDF